MTLAALDARLRKGSPVRWVMFRAVAGLLAALGLYCWLGIWFERGFWLGVAQTIMCGLVLAHELGILPARRH